MHESSSSSTGRAKKKKFDNIKDHLRNGENTLAQASTTTFEKASGIIRCRYEAEFLCLGVYQIERRNGTYQEL